MANNANVNKVEYAGTVLIDLTEDTATAADVAEGKTFHDASGALVVGTATGGGDTPVTPVLTLVEDNATERITNTTGRYWVQTGSTYKVRLKKYNVTKGAKYTIKSTATMSYATCWFGDEFPSIESFLVYVGLPISKTEWTVEATGSCMMVSFTRSSAIASNVMTVRIAT